MARRKKNGLTRLPLTYLRYEGFVDRDYAVVELYEHTAGTVLTGGTITPHGRLIGIGRAKRTQIDKPDTAIGLHLALGRAFASVARKHFRIADGLMKHYEDMARQKPEQKAPKTTKADTTKIPGVGGKGKGAHGHAS